MFTTTYTVLPGIIVVGVLWVILMIGVVAIELRAMFPGGRPQPRRASSRRDSREVRVGGRRVAAAPTHPATAHR
jgi:hypothetical protein